MPRGPLLSLPSHWRAKKQFDTPVLQHVTITGLKTTPLDLKMMFILGSEDTVTPEMCWTLVSIHLKYISTKLTAFTTTFLQFFLSSNAY